MATDTDSRHSPIPMFEQYTIDELSKRLGLTIGYLNGVKEGNKPLRRLFKSRACGILNRTEAELFGETGAAVS